MLNDSSWSLISISRDVIVTLFATLIGALLVRGYLALRKKGKESHISTEVKLKSLGSQSSTKMFVGFIISILAGLAWGLENVVTRYTVREFPTASFEVALIQYLMAGLAIILIAMFSLKNLAEFEYKFYLKSILTTSFFVSAVAKGLTPTFGSSQPR